MALREVEERIGLLILLFHLSFSYEDPPTSKPAVSIAGPDSFVL